MTTKFTFLILPEVHLLDLAGPDQVISEAIDFGADFSMEYCGIESSVNSSAGLNIGKLRHFSKVKFNAGDFLIIPGSRVKYITSPAFRKNKELFNWITEAHAKQVNLVSICVGAFVLGEAGILDGLTCTTHFQLTEKLSLKFPKTIVKENTLYVSDKNVHTSAGIASGIDLMLHLLEKISDSHFAHKVAQELVVYNRRSGNEEQINAHFLYRNHVHYGIHKVQDHLIENISKKQYLSDLAELANMSERNFTRTFKKEIGLTVNEYINKIRLEKLKELMNNPDLSKKQLANKLGLESEKQLQRLQK